MNRKSFEYSNCGKMMIIIGLLVSIPLVVVPFYPLNAEYTACFVFPALFSIILGMLICKITQTDGSTIDVNDENGSLTVIFTWFWGITMGAVPFVMGRQLNVIRAVFESVSGWTTVGLTVIQDISNTPEIFLFHRSFMQFCGGLGFVMVMTFFISGKQSMNLFNAEGHPDKIMPNLKKTAQAICIMYCGFLVFGTVAYKIAGMPVFEGMTHTMSILSTGGFSPRTGSIGEYNSLAIEGVSVFLMFIGMTNFAVLMLMIKGKWKQALKVSELHFEWFLIILFLPLITLSFMKQFGTDFFTGLRKSLFAIATVMSTTGLSTSDYSSWSHFNIGVFIILMFIGGGIGSTAGGLKLSRVYLMLRLVWISIKKKLVPSSVVEIPYYYKAQGKTEIDDYLIMDTVGFVVTYMLVLTAAALMVTVTANCRMEEAVFEIASCMSGTGISIGITNQFTADSTLIIEIICMVLGRLEIFIVIVGVYSAVKLVNRGIRKRLLR